MSKTFRLRSRRRDERGAIAIIMAFFVIVMFGMAALAVDVGGSLVASRDAQKSADFSALAGAFPDNMPTPATTGTCPGGAGKLSGPQAVATSQAVKDVATYLNQQPYNYGTSASALADCDTTNGEVVFGTASLCTYALKAAGSCATALQWTETYANDTITVITPPRRVKFGMASFFGFNGVNVVQAATAQIQSPSLQRTLPFYSAQTCSYGNQTLTEPSNGTSAASVNLASPSDTGAQVETALVPNPATNPASVAYPIAAGTSLEIDGSGLTGVTQVGFFESGVTTAGPAPTTLTVTAAMVKSDTKIVIPDISSAALAQDTWYVRVRTSTTAQWSTVADKKGNLNALPLTVGSPNLVCDQGSSQGNFGSLQLPYDSPPAPNGQTDNIAYNVAVGLQHPLDYYPNPKNPTDYTCKNGTLGGVTWPGNGTKNTNCVDTKTGNVASDAAYEGLLTGVGTVPGLLTIQNTPLAGHGCAGNGVAATTVFKGYNINNDTLSCFLADSTTTIGQTDAPTYSLPGYAYSTSIYTSPRFVYVPVLGVIPDTGGSKLYQIIDFRPAFISDQPNSATQGSLEALCTTTTCNGLTMSSNGKSLNSLQVILLNPAAVPPCPVSICSGTTKYVGSGQKVERLVN